MAKKEKRPVDFYTKRFNSFCKDNCLSDKNFELNMRNYLRFMLQKKSSEIDDKYIYESIEAVSELKCLHFVRGDLKSYLSCFQFSKDEAESLYDYLLSIQEGHDWKDILFKKVRLKNILKVEDSTQESEETVEEISDKKVFQKECCKQFMRFVETDKDLNKMEKYKRRNTIRNIRRIFYKFIQVVIKKAESKKKAYNSKVILNDCIYKFKSDYLWKENNFHKMTYRAITSVRTL